MLTTEQKNEIRAGIALYKKRKQLLQLVDGTQIGVEKFRSNWSKEDSRKYDEINNGRDYVVRDIVERVVYGSAWR